MRLVTIDEASAHLRRDTDDDNSDLLLKIEAASEMVMDYIGEQDWTDSAGETYEDTAGNVVGVPKRVKAATLMLIGYLYRERDASMEHAVSPSYNVGMGYLPIGVTALLYPLRKPTLA